MIGLIILIAFVAYLGISCGVVWLVVNWARRNGRGVKRWAAFAILVMYLLVFWDHIPTLVLYKYYCNTKAGFWVYKTPEQWKVENPGVAETLTWAENSPSYEAEDIDAGYRLNERFIWTRKNSKNSIFPVGTSTESIVDLNTGNTVVRRVSVWSGYEGGKAYFRFWTAMEPCVPDSDFYDKITSFKEIGGEVK